MWKVSLNKSKSRIAVATNGNKKLEDVVSQVFGRAKTFTILDIEYGEIQRIKVINNPAASYKHGVGPIVVQTLLKLNVNTIIAPEFGPGAAALLEQNNITMIPATPNTNVKIAVNGILRNARSEST